MKRDIVLQLGIVFCGGAAAVLAGEIGSSAMVTRSVRVFAGTPVRLRLDQTISSADAHAADTVAFTVRQDAEINGVVVIPKGNAAWGSIAEASPRGRMGRSGKISIDIKGVCLADGTAAPLRAVDRTGRADRTAARKSKSDSGVGDSLLAFPAWPILLFLNGKDTTIAAGTEVTAYLDRDLMLDPAAIHSPSQTPCTTANPGETSSEASVANLRSSPEGAEIAIDGKYVGNTPSKLRLAPGEHRITVSMAGRQTWERNIVVSKGGEINVTATLESRIASAR